MRHNCAQNIIAVRDKTLPVCAPIRDPRDIARFSELVEETAGAVTVTNNGYSKFVLMRSDDYDELEARAARADPMARIAVAERERTAGNPLDAFEALDVIKALFGL